MCENFLPNIDLFIFNQGIRLFRSVVQESSSGVVSVLATKFLILALNPQLQHIVLFISVMTILCCIKSATVEGIRLYFWLSHQFIGIKFVF